jgi:hypothetical protein
MRRINCCLTAAFAFHLTFISRLALPAALGNLLGRPRLLACSATAGRRTTSIQNLANSTDRKAIVQQHDW